MLTLRIEPTFDRVKRLALRVNGRNLPGEAADQIVGDIARTVPLTRGLNLIAVTATNENGLETTREVTVMNEGEGLLDKRGTLHIVAIGVDDYHTSRGALANLHYSSRDAEAFAAAVKNAMGPAHADTQITVLSNAGRPNERPTANAVRDVLQRARNRATDVDTVVVFIAGHGVKDGADYLFLPTDAEWEGAGWRGSTVVKWSELESIVYGARGRRFLFVDTCHSAGAYNGKLGNEAFHNDVTAITATGQDEEALEIAGLIQHGVFHLHDQTRAGGRSESRGCQS